MRGRIRLVSRGDIAGRETPVVYVAHDGTETDISSCVQNVEAYLRVGSLSRARLDVLLYECEVEAEVSDLVINHYGRLWRWTWRLRRKYANVTALGDQLLCRYYKPRRRRRR